VSLHPDLERALWRRNARLRAWKAYGLPLTARWEEWKGEWRVITRCERCGRATLGYLAEHLVPEYGYEKALALGEEVAFTDMIEEYRCPHLAPILEDDPQALQELTVLELLASE
jgi:hypothetical protein